MAENPGPGGRRALLIGIDEYLHPEVSDLSGCVNDIRLMSRVLQENFRFPGGNVRTIENAEATRAAILAAMDQLVEETQANEVVVIHYSGHGSQMTDREGDEPDGLDETIVAHDSGRFGNPNRDITDDEIYERLLALTAKT